MSTHSIVLVCVCMGFKIVCVCMGFNTEAGALGFPSLDQVTKPFPPLPTSHRILYRINSLMNSRSHKPPEVTPEPSFYKCSCNATLPKIICYLCYSPSSSYPPECAPIHVHIRLSLQGTDISCGQEETSCKATFLQQLLFWQRSI